jgi:peptide/nickel transport system ATP-binding protein
MMAMHSTLGDGYALKIEDLTVGYRTAGAKLQALRSLSLNIAAGQTYGIVGESGSGKSTLALAVMGFLPANGMIESGRIIFQGEELLGRSRSAMRAIWGARMALVPQDPLASLNPSLRIGTQVAEVLQRHLGLKGKMLRQRVLELLRTVRLADPQRVYASYPHQVSGGQQQRALIAMALGTEPELLVLDEPTTGLDTTTQAAVLDLISDLMRARGTAALYVTHNLGVVARVCDRVAVLYAGELVEDGPTEGVYRQPLHPYTRGLWDSVPRLGENKAAVRLRPIMGSIPSLDELPAGCIFRPRCPLAIEICEQDPPLYPAGDGRTSRCHRWEEILRGDVSARQEAPAAVLSAPTPEHDETILGMKDVEVHFHRGSTLWEMIKAGNSPKVRAVDGVDLRVEHGSTLGLVGESGSGKTTLARAVMGLTPRTAGEMFLLGSELPAGLRQRDKETRTHLQIVIQNPSEALNPYLTVGESLRRPLQSLLGFSRSEAASKVRGLLEAVHLQPDYARRFPVELSGGEKQRVVIARAFATNPDLLVADEAVSSLDVSVQASILNLLSELQAEHKSGMLFISHDLAVVGFLADSIAVIYLGKLMEHSPVGKVFDPPYHPYTEALLSAIPLIDPEAEQVEIRLEGEVPGASRIPSGCPFHTRCPRFLGEICVDERPPWRRSEAGKEIYCHIPLEELQQDQSRTFRFKSGTEGRG